MTGYGGWRRIWQGAPGDLVVRGVGVEQLRRPKPVPGSWLDRGGFTGPAVAQPLRALVAALRLFSEHRRIVFVLGPFTRVVEDVFAGAIQFPVAAEDRSW